MKFENVVSSSLSFLFLTGYLCITAWIMLLMTSMTPLYREVVEIVKMIPISTVLLAAPFAVIIGILFDAIRRVINKHLLRRKIYDFAYLSAETRQTLIETMHKVLSGKTKLEFLDEGLYTHAKAMWAPEFEEHSIKSRWIHDFLDSAIYVAVLSSTVLIFRMALNPLRGFDLYILIIMAVAIFFATLSLKDLKVVYTNSEVTMILRGGRSLNDNRG